ncbi:MAG: amidohydrolase family protein [Clostridia bacterium]|nr:amidohydrolase family protein [Clostridia bacterium]
MEQIKKIDIHAHATPFPQYAPPIQTGKPLVSAEDVIRYYDELNIEKGVLLPLVSAEYQYEQVTSSDCKYTSDRYPERFLWFCGIDPRGTGHSPKADHSIVLNHYKQLGAKGVGELTAQLYADDPLMDNLFYHCAECDMPVTIHIAPSVGENYGIVDELGLPRLEKMLKKHKKLKILGHSQLFWAEISADVTEESRNGYPTGKVTEGRIAKLLREYENLYCDLSAGSGMNAMMRDPEYAARFMEEFSDSILYGCDLCNVGQRHPYRFEEFLNTMRKDGMISEETYYKFVRGNAIKLLKL